MPARYDRERIHRLFLEENGDIRSMLRHPDTPNSPRTIAKYAREGGWYEELSNRTSDQTSIEVDARRIDDVERLERIRAIIYRFLVPGMLEGLDMLELKPKTYTEAVKCYLEVDARIDEKTGKRSDSGFGRWEEIVLRCLSSPGVGSKLVTDRNETAFGNAESEDQ